MTLHNDQLFKDMARELGHDSVRHALTHLIGEGYSMMRIAKQFGIRYDVLRRRVVRFGIALPPRGSQRPKPHRDGTRNNSLRFADGTLFATFFKDKHGVGIAQDRKLYDRERTIYKNQLYRPDEYAALVAKRGGV